VVSSISLQIIALHTIIALRTHLGGRRSCLCAIRWRLTTSIQEGAFTNRSEDAKTIWGLCAFAHNLSRNSISALLCLAIVSRARCWCYVNAFQLLSIHSLLVLENEESTKFQNDVRHHGPSLFAEARESNDAQRMQLT
jgi:hypothetical protein